jgi:hypothetical protein
MLELRRLINQHKVSAAARSAYQQVQLHLYSGSPFSQAGHDSLEMTLAISIRLLLTNLQMTSFTVHPCRWNL